MIQDAEKTIERLYQEEQELIAKQEAKQRDLDELMQLMETTQVENAIKKANSKTKPRQAHSLTPQQVQELRKLDNEKARLDQLLAYEDRQLAEKTATLIEMQKKNLETEKRLESEKSPTSDDYNEYEQGLIKQIDYYTKKIQHRKEEMAKQKLQQQQEQQEQQEQQQQQQEQQQQEQQLQQHDQTQAQADTEADQDQNPQDTGNESPLDAIARYRELLDMIEKLQTTDLAGASEEAVQECEAGLEQCLQDTQQQMIKQKAQQPSHIERLKSLFQVIIPDQTFARTAGRIVELLYVSDDTKLPLHVLQEVNITGRGRGRGGGEMPHYNVISQKS